MKTDIHVEQTKNNNLRGIRINFEYSVLNDILAVFCYRNEIVDFVFKQQWCLYLYVSLSFSMNNLQGSVFFLFKILPAKLICYLVM